MNRVREQTTGGSPRTSRGLDWASISGGFDQTLADDMRMTELRTEQLCYLSRLHTNGVGRAARRSFSACCSSA